MTFTHRYDKYAPLIKITLNKDADLTEAIEAFEGFLKAAGYTINGHLDVIEDLDEKEEV